MCQARASLGCRGQKTRLNGAAWIFLRCRRVLLLLFFFFYQLQANTPPSLPGKLVCTRSNGPIKCLDYSMCRYLSAVLVVARRWFSRGECAREAAEGGGKETGTGLTWTDGRPMECDRPSCTHTHTAWLSNCWKLQLIKCGYECVKSNVDMCMPLPPAAEMIFGLMVLNSDLLPEWFLGWRGLQPGKTFRKKCDTTSSSSSSNLSSNISVWSDQFASCAETSVSSQTISEAKQRLILQQQRLSRSFFLLLLFGSMSVWRVLLISCCSSYISTLGSSVSYSGIFFPSFVWRFSCKDKTNCSLFNLFENWNVLCKKNLQLLLQFN